MNRLSVRLAACAMAASLLAACGAENPSPSSSAAHLPSASPVPTPTEVPTPTPVARYSFPLAVVTGITNLKAAITLDEVAALASAGELMIPCGVVVEQPQLASRSACMAAEAIPAAVEAEQTGVGLLPAGLVEPASRVLRIAGNGPFGLFGPDLFGDSRARGMDYPVIGSALPDDPQVDVAWTAYDPSEIWTLTNLGSLCADRGAANQAVTQGKGWDWVFKGGTAEYASPAVVDPPDGGPYYSVEPVDTGHDGVTPRLVRRSDVAMADHECPVLPSANWTPAVSGGLSLAVPDDVLPYWRDTLGLDVVYLAANHMSDRGVAGIQSTLQLIDEVGIPRTGMGMDLEEALEPAYVEVAGLKVAFVAFNDVYGVARAAPGTPGVAWITEANVYEAVARARDGGADMVICAPQWWGGAEYHDDMWPLQVTQLGWFDAAGCDHTIGSGTHVAGPLLLEGPAADPRLVLVSPGNYLFGQGWWQETQEGVILEATFRGTTLVNVRLHPTVMILQARPALLDPEGDGHYVMERIWKYAQVSLTR